MSNYYNTLLISVALRPEEQEKYLFLSDMTIKTFKNE